MSLDLVELVMGIEEEFGVNIPERVAERLRTVGDLYDLLLEHRALTAEGVCLSAATFYRTPRALCELCAPFEVPGLQRPGWLRALLVAFAALAPAGGLIALCLPSVVVDTLLPLETVLVCLSATGIWGGAFLLPVVVRPPARCRTMRGLVRGALGGDRDRAHAALRRLSERQLWDRLCRIIATRLGVHPAGLTPQTDLVHDLGF